MLWYVIQTYTGREEKLMEMIRRVVPNGLYGECFVVYHEQLRNRGRENQVHIERIFPGYAFITSDDPDKLFLFLKRVPAMAKLLTAGEFVFMPLEREEADFLSRIMDEMHVIRLSYAATDGKNHVSYLSGPLGLCGGRIRAYQFRKRYAAVSLTICGQEKEVRMGIILNDDIRREMTYGRVEAPIAVPRCYGAAFQENDALAAGGGRSDTPAKTAAAFAPGDMVSVIDGAFEGNVAVVSQVRKNVVRISVSMFGREISAEVPAESVRRAV